MRKRLGRDEIEALLASPEEDGEHSRVHDFRRVECLAREQLAALQILQETFAHELSLALCGQIGSVVEARAVPIEQHSYSGFSTSVPCPTIFASLSCTPLERKLVLEVNPGIALPLIDRLDAGDRDERATSAAARRFTREEWQRIRSILGTVLDALAAAWARVLPVEFRLLETETQPNLLRVIADDEAVTVLGVEVRMGRCSGLVHLCVPFAAWPPVLDRLCRRETERRADDDRRSLLESVREATMDVSVTLAEVPIGIGDLLSLRPDDVIDLEKAVEAELTLNVEAEGLFLGRPGQVNGKKAFRVSRPAKIPPRGGDETADRDPSDHGSEEQRGDPSRGNR